MWVVKNRVKICDAIYKAWHSHTCTRFLTSVYYSETEDMSSNRNPGYRRLSKSYIQNLGFELMSVDEDKVEAVVKHPGFSYSDFDINGHPKVWSMMNFIVSGRMFAHHIQLDDTGRTFRDFKKMTSDRLTFLVTSQLTFSKALYDHSVPKQPVIMYVNGGYIGNTSFSSLTTARSESNEFLMSNVNQTVSIDTETRRPKPLPDWWKEKYAESAKPHQSLRFEKFEKPEKIGSYRTKVGWSDTDLNHHTTWSAYARYCVDAAHACCGDKMLPNFKQNFQNGIEQIQLHYYGESLEGDELDVCVFEDESNVKKLKFDISNDEKSIFQCTMSFF